MEGLGKDDLVSSRERPQIIPLSVMVNAIVEQHKQKQLENVL
ncbi:MAG: hypothetical protein ACR5KV_04805 [Wolbachia sp.]